jgi:hypothetical protein
MVIAGAYNCDTDYLLKWLFIVVYKTWLEALLLLIKYISKYVFFINNKITYYYYYYA